MLDQKVAELLNDQINKELYSAYLYLDIANYYIDEGLNGYGNWYNIQAQEEQDHAMLMLKYLQNNGHSVTLGAIEAPGCDFKNFKEPIEKAYEHERYVTSLINNIYDAAYAAKDFRTMQFLDWFVKEQGEEEQNTEDQIKRFELFGSDPKGLYALDNELAGRTYAAPSLTL
ncbi:MAG: ferritin [Oscillospiraceae bacterium]|nr:ferritin [Oscillospiraceae bacterium]